MSRGGIVKRRIWSALCVLMLVSVSLGTGISLAKAEDKVPRFETAKCKFTVPKTLKVDCGYLFVQEDRNSASSPIIRLAVAVFRAKVKKAAPDAVVYLEGGPGGHSIDNARESFEYAFSAFVQKRDF